MAMTTEDIRAPLAARTRRAARGAETGEGMPVVVTLFVVSLLVPVTLDLGGFRLLAHRVVLLLVTVPLMFRLFGGRAGPITIFDKLVLGSVVWAGLAFFVSRPGIGAIESAGMHFAEAFGGYLVARVGIRSAEDFRRFVRLFYILILFLLPFAVIEAFTGRAILLQLIPQSHGEVWAGGPRWGLHRAQVLFAHPILYGTFVAAGFAIVWYARAPSASFMQRIFVTIPVAAAVFFSLSAGALLAVVVQCGLIFWDLIMRTVREHWKILIYLSVIGYFVLNLLSNRTPFHLLVDYATFSSGTGYYRILIYRHGIENVFQNPVFGLGFDIANWTRASWMHGSIDNFWLYMAMTYGIPCFLLLAAASGLVMHRAAKTAMPDPVDRACRTGWGIVMVGMILAGGTVHYWTTMMAFFMFMLGAGGWMSTGGAREMMPEAPSDRRPGLPARAAAPARRSGREGASASPSAPAARTPDSAPPAPLTARPGRASAGPVRSSATRPDPGPRRSPASPRRGFRDAP